METSCQPPHVFANMARYSLNQDLQFINPRKVAKSRRDGATQRIPVEATVAEKIEFSYECTRLSKKN